MTEAGAPSPSIAARNPVLAGAVWSPTFLERLMTSFVSDVRYALRTLRLAPGFSTVAILSLALGIGANTTIFSVTNAVLFRRLPAPQPEQLTRIVRGSHSPLDLETLRYARQNATSFSAIVGERLATGTMTTADGRTDRFDGAIVTNDFFSGLALRPAVGHLFAGRADTLMETGTVVVLSHGFWQSRFGADPNIVGRTIRLNEQPFTVVGIAPAEFTSTVLGWRPSGWVPLANVRELTSVPLAEWNGSLYTTGRLKPAVGLSRAAAELEGLAARLRQSDSSRYAEFNFRVLPAQGVEVEARQAVRAISILLSAMVGIVLLIACANVANLMLARAAGRRREIAVRLALGASRGRLVRQLLIESAVLAFAGGAVGLAVTLWATRLLPRLIPADTPVALNFAPDPRVLAFTAALCVVTGILFGLAPALRASRADLVESLKDDLRLQGFRRSRLRNAFVIAQVALGLVLLSAASLFLRSLVTARSMNPGFDTRNVVDVRIDLRPRHYDDERSLAVYREILARTRSVPGVSAATVAGTVLLEGSNTENVVTLPGAALGRGVRPPIVSVNVVGSDYFETLSIQLRAGRGIRESDIASRLPVVVISETMAKRFWPNESAIGKRFRFGRDTSAAMLEVVGVARDVKYYTIGESPRSLAYVPVSEQSEHELALQVRTTVPAAAIGPRLEAIVRDLEPTLPPPHAKPIRDDMRVAFLPARAGAIVFGSFGLLALALATVGLYGVTSYVVSQRTREMGVRAALGARQIDLLFLSVRDTLRLVGVGVVLGLAGAYGLARLVVSLLYEARPGDPIVLGGATLVLAAAAVAASYIPARRAALVDPVISMRTE
jgi:predicted permease